MITWIVAFCKRQILYKYERKNYFMKNKLFLISFLNKLGYNLQCYERPLTIVLEKMGINYMYYMLFFKEYDTMIWGSNLQQYVSQKLGVDFITKFKSVRF